MASEKGLVAGRKGMQRDKHPGELSKEEYSFMLNGNFQDEHGNGTVILQNEPSNIKCSGFKPGYKVIGHKFDINADRTYFFLVNPDTGCSEIGYISSFYQADSLEALERNCNCNITVILENPLEMTEQISICEYTTLISDFCQSTGECTGCLNFNINYPIKENNIQIKRERTGTNMYFTDFLNPQRYLQLDDLEIYTQTEDDCDGNIESTCFQCDKLRVFQLFNKPCLYPRIIQNGGNLRAGVYEALVAYSTLEGEELSDYYSITNPIHVFDKNNNVLDQTNLDYITNQSIGLSVEDMDMRYSYYKIAIIYRSGLDSSVSSYEYGVYPISTDRVSISTLVDKKKGNLIDFLGLRRTVYTNARGIVAGNNTLFQYGLKAHKEINLQPVVNLMGAFVKWSTVQGSEDLYENGVYISNYLGYMRDEVVPLSIKFFGDGGYEYSLCPFIPRPAFPEEIEILGSPDFPEDPNTESVLDNNPSCTENNRNKRWQFENTAQIQGRCEVQSSGYEEDIVEREVESSCYVEDESGDFLVVATIPNSSIQVDTDKELVDYINTHIDEIIASTGPNGADIRDILEDPSQYPETCSPDFGDNCSEDTELVKEEIFAIDVEIENTSQEDFTFSQYNRPTSPQNCNIYQLDENSLAIVDQIFVDNYMESGEEVFKRVASPSNTSCTSGSIVPLLTDPQIDNSNFLLNKGEIGSISTLQGSLNVSATRTRYVLTLTGTSGTANITVNGTPYLATFATSLTVTAANFVTAHAAAILADTGATVTSSGANILISDSDSLSPTLTISNLTGDLLGSIVSVNFTNKLHTNAIWFKVEFNGQLSTIFELTNVNCAYLDDNSSKSVRINVFQTCSASGDLSTYSRIVDDITAINDPQKFIQFDSFDFGGVNSTVFIAIDSPIRRRMIEDQDNPGTFIQSNTLTPPCGCFSTYQREVKSSKVISYTNLTFGKKSTYKSLCEFTIPNFKGCDPIPYQYGLFSHWESEQKYPCNNELFDSSTLVIEEEDIPDSIKDEFEDYYTTNITGGQYVLNAETNFQDKGIRHYKFPDSRIVPFMSFNKNSENQDPGPFKPSVIYPIGFSIDNEVINAFLDIAVKNGLLILQERAKINRYEIFRGDRRTDKSIIAKGLLFDMYNYEETSGDISYYSNYPLNSLGIDVYNGGREHPYLSSENRFFTFHSPDTSFEKPTLPRELSIEGYQFGKAANYFDEVSGHSTYVLLGDRAYQIATTLAVAEVAFEILLQISDLSVNASTGSIGLPGGAIILGTAIAGIVTTGVFRVGELRYKWLKTFIDLGKPNNFAYYQVAIGHYGTFYPSPDKNQSLRGLSSVTYLKPGRFSVVDETISASINVNNVDREESVFLSLGTNSPSLQYPSIYKSFDNSSFDPASASRRGYAGTGRSQRIESNCASPYVSLKQYLPSQYGSIYSVEWLNTGFCGDLNKDSQCDPIFGGDTYISRFSVKRKLPFFTSNARELAPLTPFAYSDYFNVNPDPNNRTSGYYLDYLINDDLNNFVSLFVFPTPRSTFNLDPESTDENVFYIKPPAKFYLFSYGIPYFLVESTVNCNFRYAKREAFENFYPNVGDIVDWTQEKNVSIKQPNTFFYNPVYSSEHSFYPWRMLPINYSAKLFDRLDNLENTVIYSKQDNSDTSLSDPWLLYKAFDFFNFPKDYGRLVDMKSIESEQILARFRNGFGIFGAIDQIRDRLTPETGNLGNGGIFAGRVMNFNKTELGYGGTQHSAIVSCEFGHFWVDAKRGQVFNLGPNGSAFNEITQGCEKWFKEQLPFKILGKVEGLTDLNLDNSYNDLGITMGWDSRLKRVFLTKKDYIPIVDGIKFEEGIGFYTSEPQPCPDGYERQGDFCVKGADRIPYSDRIVTIQLQDKEYFDECSFTVAYSPLTKTWISYYSFKPNYYVSYNDYFQTGINFSSTTQEIGVWSHFPFMSSWQVFYGRKYPWIVEYPLQTKFTNSMLEGVEYWLDTRKYYDRYNSANVPGYSFNKAVVYNNHQNSGLLNLVTQRNKDLRQHLMYPKYNLDSVDILQTEIAGKWSFNYLYHMVKDERSGLPIWLNDCNEIEKVLNTKLFDYKNRFKDRMRGDFFLVRLIQDAESRFKMILRFGVDQRSFYEQ